MSIRLSRPLRPSLVAALVLACAAFGFAAFTEAAHAQTFTLNSGTIELEEGSATGTPPTTGSWVQLPEHAGSGAGTFKNGASGAASNEYTLISGELANPGFELGKFQTGAPLSKEEIFRPLTEFGPVGRPEETFPFYAYTIEEEEVEPEIIEKYCPPILTFEGDPDVEGTYQLTAPSDLNSLWINYGPELEPGHYHVGTRYGNDEGIYVHSLTGSLEGDASGGTITLEWTTHILQPPFTPWDAHFKWVGTYRP